MSRHGPERQRRGTRRARSSSHGPVASRTAPAADERLERVATVARRDAADEILDRLRLTATLTYEAANLSSRDLPRVDEDRLNLLVSLYGPSGSEDAQTRVAAFVTDRHEQLVRLFEAYSADPRADALLAPEVLLIFERLEHDPDRLRASWQRDRPLDELEELASVFGVTI
jgi:hypothetical protein